MKRIFFSIALTLILFNLNAQVDFGSFGNKIKDKAKEAGKEKLIETKNNTLTAIDKKLEKSRQEFDDSNFNYAISFADNSGLFETNEKGTRATGALKNTMDFLNEKETSNYQRAYGYNSKGEIFFAGNMYGSARNMFKVSEFWFKRSDSLNSFAYAQLMNNMALLYQTTNRFSKAMEYIDKAIAIRSNRMPNSLMLAVSLNNKGVLLKDLGSYAESEKYLNEALSMNKSKAGENSLGYALCLNNLAMLYQATGQMEKAETNMIKCIELAKPILKETSGNYLKLTINLAYIYRDQKKYKQAEDIFLNAIAIKQKKLGTNHPDYAHLRRGLAELYWEMGNLNEVEKNLQAALEIYIRKFTNDNSATAATKADLANFYRLTGKKEKALEMMQQVIETDKKIYGENHPHYTKDLEDLAIAQWVNNKVTEASSNYKTVISKTNAYISDYFNALSENEKTRFWEKTQPRFQRFTSFVLSQMEKDPTLVGDLLNNQLNNKALLLNSSSKLRNSILSSGDQNLIDSYNSWLSSKEELARLYSLSKEELKDENANLDSLENVADQSEKKLSEESKIFRESNQKEIVTWQKLQNVLNPDEVLCEMVRNDVFENKFTGEIYYAAIILKKSNNPECVLLKNGTDMDGKHTASYRAAIMDQKDDKTSYEIFFKPIEEKTKPAKKIYFSPDGTYNQISLLTLKRADGTFLIDNLQIQILGNSKDVLSQKENQIAARTKTAFLLGFPNYGTSDMIPPLPGTKTEVENISKTLKAAGYKPKLLMQNEATEENLKNAGEEVIHIATHGFFLDDLNSVSGDKVLGVEISKARKNPLLRSGLLLANCEKVFDETGEKLGTNNGILTAYEAMNMHLENTDLVVLSACQTGLGDIKAGEGVYGLQRSFLIAGAHSLIMSLWEVSDEATMELMSTFYKNYAQTGKKQESFLLAQKAVKAKYKSPFFWGAFVLIGK